MVMAETILLPMLAAFSFGFAASVGGWTVTDGFVRLPDIVLPHFRQNWSVATKSALQ